MDGTEERAAKLRGGSEAAQIALAAACAQRVVPIFDEYWEGSHSEAPSRAVALGWARARGESVDPRVLAETRAEIERFVSYYNEEGIGILAAVVTVALRVCECLEGGPAANVAKAASRACGSTLHAAVIADVYINNMKPIEKGPAEVEEKAWLDGAIARASQCHDAEVHPELFHNLGPTPPRWFGLYQSAPTHL